METCLGEHSKHAQLTPEGRSLTARRRIPIYAHIDRDVHMYTQYTYMHTCTYIGLAYACVLRIRTHDRTGVASDSRGKGGSGVGYLGGRGDRSGQTDVPTSAGTPKTRRRRRWRRRRRETRNPRTPPGQVFDCPTCGSSSKGRRGNIAMEIDLSGRKVPEAAHGLVMEISSRYPALESRTCIRAATRVGVRTSICIRAHALVQRE